MRGSRTALAIATALVVGLPATAGAQSFKPYDVLVAPEVVNVGTASEIRVTLTNLTPTQELGSARITAPSSFTITGQTDDGPGTVLPIAANVVELNNAAVQPNGSVTVTLTANTTTAPLGPASFAVEAKQANEFNGTGNLMNSVATTEDLTIRLISPQKAFADCVEPSSRQLAECKTDVAFHDALSNATPSGQVISMGASAKSEKRGSQGRLDAEISTGVRQLDCLGLQEVSRVTGVVTGPVNFGKVVTFTIENASPISFPRPICYAGPARSVSAPGFPENPPFVEGGLTFYPAVLANCTDQIRKRSACVDSRSLDGTIVRVFTPALYADPFYRG